MPARCTEKAATRLEKFCDVQRHDDTRFTVTCPVGNTFRTIKYRRTPLLRDR